MKHYPWRFKLALDGLEWYKIQYDDGAHTYAYYFKCGLMDKAQRAAWRTKPYGQRVFGSDLIGLHKFWYDCPHAQLNLYWIVFYWYTQWTTMPKDYWK